MRINEQVFLNDNIFVKGLLTEATMYEPDGAGGRTAVRGSTVTWGFRDLRAVADDFDSQGPVTTNVAVIGDTDTVGSHGRSIAPLTSTLDEYWYDGGRTFEKRTEYEHDGLGNVIVENDLGAPRRSIRRSQDRDRLLQLCQRRCRRHDQWLLAGIVAAAAFLVAGNVHQLGQLPDSGLRVRCRHRWESGVAA